MLDGSKLSRLGDRLKDFATVREESGGFFANMQKTRQQSFQDTPVEMKMPPVEAEQLKSPCSECGDDFIYDINKDTKKVIGV